MATGQQTVQRGPGLRELRELSDAELVSRHDELLSRAGPDDVHLLGPEAYRDVLRLRVMELQARELARLALVVYLVSALTLALLVAILVVSA
jgi:hypothetical protein